jgi:PAS domain S-box-containing protein
MTNHPDRPDKLLAEIAALRLRLEEAEETLRAIGSGEVDAFVVSGPGGKQIFTLKGAEHPYRLLVETMNEGAATLGLDGTILYCNQSLAALLQIPQEQLIGSKFDSFVAEQDRSLLFLRLKAGATGYGSDEIQLLSRASSPVPVLVSCRPVELSGSSGTSMIVTDLTQQKRNEAIIASEGLARSIIEQAGEAILVCDEIGTIIRASRIAYQLFGQNPLQQNFDTLFQPAIQGKAAPFSVLPALSGQSVESLEVEYRRGSGESRHLILNATPLYSSRSEITGCVVTLTDITERKKSESMLQNTLQRFYQMFAGMYSGVLLMTEEGRVEFVNQAFCDAYGLSEAPEALAGLSSGEFLPKILPAFQHPEKAALRIKETLAAAQPVRTEELGMQGGRRALRDFAPLIIDGKPCGRFWINTDITELKRAEEAQRDSDLRFRLATEATGVGIWEWNLLTNQVRWDNQMFRIYGMAPTPDGLLRYEDWSASVLPEDLPRQEEILRETALRGGKSTREFRIWRSGDGTCRVIRAVETVRRNDRGDVEWVVGSNLDITEPKQAMEAKAALAAIVESSEDAIISKSLDGTITSWNAAAQRLFGYSNDEMVGQSVTLIIPPELQGEESAILERLQGGRSISHLETVRLAKGGSRIQVSLTISPVRNASGIVTGASKIVRDITERKRTEAALKELNEELEQRVATRTGELAATVTTLQLEISEREAAEENLRRLNRLYLVLSETNHAIVCTRDTDLLFSDICRIAVEDGGFRLAWIGLVDQPGGSIRAAASFGASGYLDDITASDSDGLRHAWPAGIAVRVDTHCICNDFLGSLRTSPWQEAGAAHGIASAASIPLKREGKVIGALTLYAGAKDFFDRQQTALLQQIGADLSFALDNINREIKRREAEQALHDQTLERLLAVEALREKEQMLVQQSRQAAMGEMISNIAHQWRQPLNTLALSIQEAKMMYDFGECTGEFMETSTAKSMGLIQHMSQTIDDFRDYFKPDKDKTRFQVSEVVASTLILVQDSFNSQRVAIEIVTEQTPEIFGYRNEYAQTLLNILNNARDALTERKIAHPRVTVTLSSAGGRAVVTVADNAGGIPEEIIDKVFDPYFTTKGPQIGTGLGLFMSKNIIEKNLGGSLTVRNNGDGAEFRIEV